MRILIVNKFLHPNGGSETYVFQIGQELIKMGHQVEYFGMDHENRIVGNHLDCYTANMDFHTGSLQKLFYPFKIIYSREAELKMFRIMKEFQPEIVHVNNFNFQLTPSILYAVKKFEKYSGKKVKLIYTAHDAQLVCPNHMMLRPTGDLCEECLGGNRWNCTKYKCIHGSLVKSLLGSLEAKIYQKKRTYLFFDKVICPSFFLENVLSTNPDLKGRTRVIHNFIAKRELYPVEKKDYVLYFGRYSKEKGIETLVEVCKQLKDIPFVFAGKGLLEDKTHGISNIDNKGFLSGDDLYETIAAARMVIFPSEWYENCPFSVIESQYYGTPVIASKIGGTPELVSQGKTGELFEAGNRLQLKQKIEELWTSRSKLEEYTQNCKSKTFMDIHAYCEELIKIYEEK